METTIEIEGLRLKGHLARPAARAVGDGPRCGLVLCHGFPSGPRGAATSGETYPELADRLSAETGWYVLTFNFRGTGDSDGDFSLAGWLRDVAGAVDRLLEEDVDGVWVAGFSLGGSLAICAAGEDERIRGVAALAAPADFGSWAANPKGFLEHAREVGVIRDAAFPADFDGWARQLQEIRPLSLVGKIPPRPLLLIHGADDEQVPLMDARVLADSADGEEVQLRVIQGAGHRLRHDPRAVAVLLGWLDRQHL